MRNKLGDLCMVLGAALILAALSLLLWNRQEDSQAGAAAGEILHRVVEYIETPAGERPETPTVPDPYDPSMTEMEIDGYAYIGYLSIPAIQLELPVMAEWDYDRLKIAPCRYVGSVKTDDLVLCAHNYTQHFGLLRDLEPGNDVYFTDMDSNVWAYQVSALEILPPTAMEDMIAGAYDLTLFTCTYGGESRVTVRCDRVQKQ